MYNICMADRISREQRSLNMAAIHSKNTGPELAVRKIVFSLGYRYRLHDPKLPGKPDLVFPSRRKVLFVHGCFWHGHNRCRRATTPKTHTEFWQRKIAANMIHDRQVRRRLRDLGWKPLTIWQCELRNQRRLTERIDEFLAA